MTCHPISDPLAVGVPGSDDKRKSAYKLFIEILAYQLASPVRWIETQNELLKRIPTIRRFVEIGPRTTLATMAKKSASKHASQSSPHDPQLEFLSYPNHQDEILFRYQEPESTKDVGTRSLSVPQRASPIPAVTTVAHTHEERPTKNSAVFAGFMPSANILLSAGHVVLAMTAQKLQRPFDQVPMEGTIRELSGGKSTLQNELTGDLVAEFGKVPEGVEDMSLITVGEILQRGFTGKPGKQMAALVSRLVSGRMPAGFNQNAIQDYLQSQWGLSKEHSIVPICFATTVEPQARLSSSEEAQAYLDELINRYAPFQGIEFTAASDQNNQSSRPHSVVIDAASFDAVNKEHRDFQRKQLDLLAKHLQIRINEGQSEDMQTNTQELEEKLQQWNAELDDQFFQGVQPIFDSSKARHYDSWWNWTREELVRWLNDASQDLDDVILSSMDDRLRRTLNRWESSCTDIVQFMLETADSSQCSTSEIRPMLTEMLRLGAEAQAIEPTFIYSEPPLAPKTNVSSTGRLEYQEVRRNFQSYTDIIRQGRTKCQDRAALMPFVHIKTRCDKTDWEYDAAMTDAYHRTLDLGATSGLTYSGKTVLVTGAGPGSIGAMVVKGLIAGGARVIVTTSRAVSDSAPYFQRLYREYGARDSSLTLLPMNQASKQDCEALIEYIYGEESPIGGDLDFVVPFAAIPQTGELETLNSKNELALRAMLINVLRLAGLVRRAKEKRRIDTRPTMFILPMSCNEGTFGGDGLYAESKLGLKTLFNRFFSETWSTYVTICGAVIGWTRGTGLMRTTNMIAADVEKIGVITFTQAEMAFNILALMTPQIAVSAEDAPVYADLTGGFGDLWNVKQQIAAARQRLSDELDLRNALAEEDARHQEVLFGPQPQSDKGKPIQRASLSIGFPRLESHHTLAAGLPQLDGMIDLSRTVVVVGFSELGPWGNARTRWEMENRGQFSLEGYMEMAWIMGLIKHVDGELKGEPYVGWVDSKTESPVNDSDVPDRYHEDIMRNVGLRLISPDERDGYDPSRKEYLHEVAVEEDLPPFECSKSTADAFLLRHGNNVKVQPVAESDNCRVFVKKGAVLMIPKRIPFDQVVAGRIPTGWNPLRYGIPEDIVRQVDDTTLYTLCCVSEAFLSAGIHDPYEVYEHIHVSEVANCLGTGGGPMKSIRSLYRDRFLDRSVRGDIILEHFLNTTGAWVNMLLLSATGPIKTPVGACATALESLDTGCDAIQTGKCKIAIVGGCDDYTEELAYEFANIKATANGTEELAKGRLPSEISRPTASSRSGFAESAGSGVQILMSAELALKMGLPVYGILAYNQMAGDQIGRSIPAPGKGVLTAAREVGEARGSSLLDFDFRRARFDEDVADLQHRCHTQMFQRPFAECQQTEQLISLKMKEIQNRWTTQIRQQDPSISPMKAALASWGLAIDDIGVVSMHGTSTKANELNEGDVINTQMAHLGRRKGNPLLCVCQKSLTGHPKAAAGAWQLNGCMQIMRDQIVPGNRNADNVDEQLRQYEHLVYPMESIHRKTNAVMITSFGFGQKGAISIIVAPRYLFASLSPTDYEEYRERVNQRQRLTSPEFISRVLKQSLVQVKSQPPWEDSEAMRRVFLDPNSRLMDDQYAFTQANPIRSVSDTTFQDATQRKSAGSIDISSLVQSMLDNVSRSSTSPVTNVGVDVENITSINTENTTFIERNFTEAERDYCSKAADPRASFAGRWSAKEAIFKSLQTESMGAGAAMQDIEIINHSGIPKVMLHGHVQEIAATKGISNINVTISHSAETAIAVALATGIQ